MQTYLDYRITIVGDGRVRTVYMPPQAGGESAASGRIDQEAIQSAILLSGRLAAGQATPEEIQSLGESLWKVLFPEEVRAHFLEIYRDILRIPEWGLRIRLDIDESIAPEQAYLPWEYLRYPGDAHSQAFLFATHARLVISRYRSLYEVASAITLDANEKLRILVAVASPEKLPVVYYEPVWKKIRELPDHDLLFDQPHIIKATTPQAFDEGLRYLKPHIVHVMAHSQFQENDGQIALLDRDGHTPRWYSALDFAALFESWTPGLVLLHACEGAQSSKDVGFVGLASRVLHGNIPVVVAMRYAITNRIAIAFAQEFYTCLAKGESVDAAVQLGRRAIGRDYGFTSRDFAVPTLFMRVLDGRFFSRKQDEISNLQFQSIQTIPHEARLLLDVYHNLPQKGYAKFVGRQLELHQVMRFISEDWGACLLGIIGTSGVGKTTLALEATHRLLQGNLLSTGFYPAAIVWATARTAQLTASGVMPNRQPINTLEDIYTAIAITLKRQDILRAPREEQDELIKQVLIERGTLIVIDNYETVDDDRVFSFLQSLPPPTKVIITSRYNIDCPVIIKLNELQKEDGLIFVREEASHKNVNFSQEDIAQLFEATCGIPLAIVWSIAQISYGFTLEATVQLLEDAGGDVITFCFGRAVDSVRSSDAYYMLLSIALFVVDASREALGIVSDFGADIVKRDRGLVTLKKLGLIEQVSNRFKILSITKRLIEAELETRRDFVDKARERQIKYFLDFLRKYNPKQEPTPPMEPFWEEVQNIQSLVRWCRIQGNYKNLASLACAYAPFLWTHGLWQDLFEITLWITESIQITNDWSTLAEINLHTILAYMDQYKPEKMLEHIKVVEQAFQHMNSIPDDLMETYLFSRGAAATLLDDSNAQSLLEEDLLFARKMGVHWRIAGTLYWMGTRAYDKQEWEEADKYFSQALHIAESYEDKRSMALVYAYLPEVIYRLGDVGEAYRVYERVSKFVDSHGQMTSKGQLALGIAKVMEATEKMREALIQAQKALEIYTDLRRYEAVQECEILIERIQQAMP